MLTVPANLQIIFDSSFAKASAVTEIVSLKLEKDGRWRVAGYTMK